MGERGLAKADTRTEGREEGCQEREEVRAGRRVAGGQEGGDVVGNHRSRATTACRRHSNIKQSFMLQHGPEGPDCTAQSRQKETHICTCKLIVTLQPCCCSTKQTDTNCFHLPLCWMPM